MQQPQPTQNKAIHFKEMQQMLDLANERKQTVNVKAWEAQTGNIIEYNGWTVLSSNWKGGWHRLSNPVSGQIRTVPDIFIFWINGLGVYL